MGHREPCLAQLAIWSTVVRAYCIAPFLTSWLGSGTSRRRRPVTGNLVPSLAVDGVVIADSAAPFLLEEDIVAVGMARIIEG